MIHIRQAVILAGGQGTRLRPLTYYTPKPMLLFSGKPFLQYIVELLKDNGIREVVLLVGYLHEQIERYFGDGGKFGVHIKYSYSFVDSGTGTRLRTALPLLAETFLLLYGDNYWSLNLNMLEGFYQRVGTKALVTVYGNRDNITRNNMYVKGDFVLSYDKQRLSKMLNGVDIGFFILNKNIFLNTPEYNFSFEEVILPMLIEEKQLAAFVTHDRYYGLSTIDRIPLIQDYFKKIFPFAITGL